MRRAEYNVPWVWTRDSAENAFRTGAPSDVCAALVAVTLHDMERAWVESWLRRLADHADEGVRAVVATCIGHVARIHGAVDPKLAGAVLDGLGAEPSLAGRVTDTRHDLAMFLQPDAILSRFNDRQRASDLPFVLGDEVEVTEGIYASKRGTVDLLGYAESPIQYLVDFGDGTDEYLPATSLTLIAALPNER